MVDQPERSLPTTLAAEEGVVCAVGAGGKKTTLYTLANTLDQAVVTATVRIPIFDDHVARVAVTEDPTAAVETTEQWPLGVVPEQERADRYRGYDPAVIDTLARSTAAKTVLVKADGARMRLLKAPATHEPQIPASADTVLVIASVHAVGAPLTDETVHRPERVAELTDLTVGDQITPHAVAAVVGDKHGGLSGIPDEATVVVLLNMVDTEEDRGIAKEIAAELVEVDRIERIVLAQMQAAEPLVGVVN